MADLTNVKEEELRAELSRRGAVVDSASAMRRIGELTKIAGEALKEAMNLGGQYNIDFSVEGADLSYSGSCGGWNQSG